MLSVPLTAEVRRDGEWFVAFCPEVPEANGQGPTQPECRASRREAILLLMDDRREDAQKRRENEAALLELNSPNCWREKSAARRKSHRRRRDPLVWVAGRNLPVPCLSAFLPAFYSWRTVQMALSNVRAV